MSNIPRLPAPTSQSSKQQPPSSLQHAQSHQPQLPPQHSYPQQYPNSQPSSGTSIPLASPQTSHFSHLTTFHNAMCHLIYTASLLLHLPLNCMLQSMIYYQQFYHYHILDQNSIILKEYQRKYGFFPISSIPQIIPLSTQVYLRHNDPVFLDYYKQLQFVLEQQELAYSPLNLSPYTTDASSQGHSQTPTHINSNPQHNTQNMIHSSNRSDLQYSSEDYHPQAQAHAHAHVATIKTSKSAPNSVIKQLKENVPPIGFPFDPLLVAISCVLISTKQFDVLRRQRDITTTFHFILYSNHHQDASTLLNPTTTAAPNTTTSSSSGSRTSTQNSQSKPLNSSSTSTSSQTLNQPLPLLPVTLADAHPLNIFANLTKSISSSVPFTSSDPRIEQPVGERVFQHPSEYWDIRTAVTNIELLVLRTLAFSPPQLSTQMSPHLLILTLGHRLMIPTTVIQLATAVLTDCVMQNLLQPIPFPKSKSYIKQQSHRLTQLSVVDAVINNGVQKSGNDVDHGILTSVFLLSMDESAPNRPLAAILQNYKRYYDVVDSGQLDHNGTNGVKAKVVSYVEKYGVDRLARYDFSTLGLAVLVFAWFMYVDEMEEEDGDQNEQNSSEKLNASVTPPLPTNQSFHLHASVYNQNQHQNQTLHQGPSSASSSYQYSTKTPTRISQLNPAGTNSAISSSYDSYGSEGLISSPTDFADFDSSGEICEGAGNSTRFRTHVESAMHDIDSEVNSHSHSHALVHGLDQPHYRRSSSTSHLNSTTMNDHHNRMITTQRAHRPSNNQTYAQLDQIEDHLDLNQLVGITKHCTVTDLFKFENNNQGVRIFLSTLQYFLNKLFVPTTTTQSTHQHDSQLQRRESRRLIQLAPPHPKYFYSRDFHLLVNFLAYLSLHLNDLNLVPISPLDINFFTSMMNARYTMHPIHSFFLTQKIKATIISLLPEGFNIRDYTPLSIEPITLPDSEPTTTLNISTTPASTISDISASKPTPVRPKRAPKHQSTSSETTKTTKTTKTKHSPRLPTLSMSGKSRKSDRNYSKITKSALTMTHSSLIQTTPKFYFDLFTGLPKPVRYPTIPSLMKKMMSNVDPLLDRPSDNCYNKNSLSTSLFTESASTNRQRRLSHADLGPSGDTQMNDPFGNGNVPDYNSSGSTSHFSDFNDIYGLQYGQKGLQQKGANSGVISNTLPALSSYTATYQPGGQSSQLNKVVQIGAPLGNFNNHNPNTMIAKKATTAKHPQTLTPSGNAPTSSTFSSLSSTYQPQFIQQQHQSTPFSTITSTYQPQSTTTTTTSSSSLPLSNLPPPLPFDDHHQHNNNKLRRDDQIDNPQQQQQHQSLLFSSSQSPDAILHSAQDSALDCSVGFSDSNEMIGFGLCALSIPQLCQLTEVNQDDLVRCIDDIMLLYSNKPIASSKVLPRQSQLPSINPSLNELAAGSVNYSNDAIPTANPDSAGNSAKFNAPLPHVLSVKLPQQSQHPYDPGHLNTIPNDNGDEIAFQQQEGDKARTDFLTSQAITTYANFTPQPGVVGLMYRYTPAPVPAPPASIKK